MGTEDEDSKEEYANWKASDSLEQENSFESQYDRKDTFDINGAKVESIDIKPEHQKDEVPVLVVPGWGATMESFKPGMKVLTDKERRVVSLDFPRKGGTIPESSNEEINNWYCEKGKKVPKWPAEELRKANTILGLLDQKQIDKVDVIPHSEAAINVSIAAMLHPEKFKGRTIVYYSPAGLIGKDNIFRLQKGAAANTSRTETITEESLNKLDSDSMSKKTKDYLSSLQQEYLASTEYITPDYMKANPLRALKEVWAISQAETEDMFQFLREHDIRIIVVAAVDDTMFPVEKMQKNPKLRTDLSKDTPNEGTIDGFVVVRGGHMQIQVHPEVYMSVAEKMLEQPKK